METNQTRLCKSCGDRIRGRIDKMYCDDRCRNQFHNKEKRRPALTVMARSIQHQLMKNRMVLLRHLRERKCGYVERDQLLRDGFSFELFTHRCLTRGGKETIFCYEFGYRLGAGQRIMVVRQTRSVGIFR